MSHRDSVIPRRVRRITIHRLIVSLRFLRSNRIAHGRRRACDESSPAVARWLGAVADGHRAHASRRSPLPSRTSSHTIEREPAMQLTAHIRNDAATSNAIPAPREHGSIAPWDQIATAQLRSTQIGHRRATDESRSPPRWTSREPASLQTRRDRARVPCRAPAGRRAAAPPGSLAACARRAQAAGDREGYLGTYTNSAVLHTANT